MVYEQFKQKLEQNPEYQKAAYDLQLSFALADAILSARLDKGWSQSELARRVGTRQANISRIEAGLANPTLSLVDRICRALEIELRFMPASSGELADRLVHSNLQNASLSVAEKPGSTYLDPNAKT